MTLEDFSKEMHKLITRFDKRYYPPEVVDILWREVQALGYFWFRSFVATGMGQHRPPLIPEFKESAGIEKNRLRALPSIQSTNDPHAMFTVEQRKFLFRLVNKVANKSISSETVDNVIVPLLTDIIDKRDSKRAHNFFRELAHDFVIPYNDDPGAA